MRNFPLRDTFTVYGLNSFMAVENGQVALSNVYGYKIDVHECVVDLSNVLEQNYFV